MNILKNILNSKSYWTIGSATLCGIISTEMGIRTVVAIIQDKEDKVSKDRISQDLGGSIFFAICATNRISGFARFGGFLFVGSSLIYKKSYTNLYWGSKVIKFLSEGEYIKASNTWFGVAFLVTIICLDIVRRYFFKNFPLPSKVLKDLLKNVDSQNPQITNKV